MKKISGQWIRGDVQLTAGKTENAHFSDAVGNKDKKDGKQESGRTVLSPDRNRGNGLQGICFPPLKNINDVILKCFTHWRLSCSAPVTFPGVPLTEGFLSDTHSRGRLH